MVALVRATLETVPTSRQASLERFETTASRREMCLPD